MLKQRVITAAVLVTVILGVLFWLPTTAVLILFGVFVAAGAWEWAALSGVAGASRAAYAALIIALGLSIMGATLFYELGIATILYGIAVLWWLWALGAFWRDVLGVYRSRLGRLTAGVLVLVPAWIALTALHKADPNSPYALLYLLALVAVGDTAAYAAGHAFGRHKLAPSISPGKTIEGVIGAAVAVLLFAYFCGTILWRYTGPTLRIWILLSLATLLIAVLGDLVESKVKRVAGAKDSGNLLPGHGGVLDRIDAITAAAPLYVLGWLKWFDTQ
jgi:phosphatidate cytidylyltransferase